MAREGIVRPCAYGARLPDYHRAVERCPFVLEGDVGSKTILVCDFCGLEIHIGDWVQANCVGKLKNGEPDIRTHCKGCSKVVNIMNKQTGVSRGE